MSDALPLPARPRLEAIANQARALLESVSSPDPEALRRWVFPWVDTWAADWIETQARLRGASTPPDATEEIAAVIDAIEREIRERRIDTLPAAYAFLARAYGFASWSDLKRFLVALQEPGSIDEAFEAAVDAVVVGDVSTLSRLLRASPLLTRQRSTRAHRSTLLHYVAANGVEDYRQKSPHNVVEIATVLLDSGAEVNAVSSAYGGGMTALDLIATSVHPARAGLQIALLELMLSRGARIEPTPGAAVDACLVNGRIEAAEYLADRGGVLTLAGAAALGRLDIVERSVSREAQAGSNLQPQIERGFLWACQFGRTEVADFLLDHGARIEAADDRGMTGLHWAADGGHPGTAQFLLARGAPLEAKNAYGGTALAQAVWRALQGAQPEHLQVLRMLIEAGAMAGDDSLTGNQEIDAALRRRDPTDAL